MLKLEVFDPPMCCATGICGNNVDPKLVIFASDLEWLKKQGIDVVRHGLSFEPAEFVKNESVKDLLNKKGDTCLPIITIGSKVVSDSCYPSRGQLAKICKIEFNEDEAPPVHREENCCCGVDCDCSSNKLAGDTCSTSSKEDPCCGPDCDCHKSALSNTAKKVLFIIVILAMLIIIAIKTAPKVHSAEVAYPSISSFSQIKPSQDVAFVYVPSKNGKISGKTQSAMLSAKQSLEARNINVELFTLNPSSADYSAQTKTPAVVVIYKGKDKKIVSGDINTTKLLQAYMAATLAGGCGANCPCHKH